MYFIKKNYIRGQLKINNIKNVFLFLSIIFITTVNAQENSLSESTKFSEVQYITPEGKGIPLEVIPAGLITSETFKGREAKLRIKGSTSSVKIPTTDSIQFLVRLSENDKITPRQHIKLIHLNAEKKRRTTRTFIAGPLNKNGNESPEFVEFTYKKYGEYSYIVTVPKLTKGEYAFVIGIANFETNKNWANKAIEFQLFSVTE